jgi:hypothetical protein
MEKIITFKDLHKNNTKLVLPELGNVELKYISAGDSIDFIKLLNDKNADDKQLVKNILFNQLIKPKISTEEFNNISDSVLVEIAKAFITKENYTFQYFEDTGKFFSDFRNALRMYEDKQFEQLREIFKPLLLDAHKTIASFSTSYANVIQQSFNTSSYIAESLRGVTSLAQQINTVKYDFIQPFKQFAEQYNFLGEVLKNSLIPQINAWSNWTKHNTGIFQNIGNFWKEFQEEYNITEQKAVVVLQKYKWFITPSMPITFLFTVVRIDKRKGRQDKAVNKLFINYFSANRWKNTEVMVESWKGKPLLKRRIKILQNCIKILKRSTGKKENAADVVLPTLITQIDGLLSDYLTSKGIQWDCAYDDLIQQQRVKKIGRKSQFKVNRSRTMTNQLDDLANDIFLNILFQRSQKGTPLKTPFNFNRHKIIHGESTSYGRKDYVVRAIMIIDFIAHLK